MKGPFGRSPPDSVRASTSSAKGQEWYLPAINLLDLFTSCHHRGDPLLWLWTLSSVLIVPGQTERGKNGEAERGIRKGELNFSTSMFYLFYIETLVCSRAPSCDVTYFCAVYSNIWLSLDNICGAVSWCCKVVVNKNQTDCTITQPWRGIAF